MSKESWRQQAKCASPEVYPIKIEEETGRRYQEVDTEIFYPPRDRDSYKPIADAAKAICKGKDLRPPCPVRHDCLIYAIERDEEHGIFGGCSHRERNALVRKHAATNIKNRAKGKATMTLREFVSQGGPG